jgi:hypothetical protein
MPAFRRTLGGGMPPLRPAAPRKPGLGSPLQSSEAIAARVDDMERKIERLRALYESHFLGIERRPPVVPRQELNRLVLELQQVQIRNAALRFRFQSVSQRWTLLVTYWNRTLREIESGTYRRDLQKAYRRIAARGEPMSEEEATALVVPPSRAKAFVAQQNRRWVAPPTPDAPLGAERVADPTQGIGRVASVVTLPDEDTNPGSDSTQVVRRVAPGDADGDPTNFDS